MPAKSKPAARRESITIRNLDPAIKKRLRLRAARNSRSMEAEARTILELAVNTPEPPADDNLYDRIRARFGPLGGVELDIPDRKLQQTRPLPDFK